MGRHIWVSRGWLKGIPMLLIINADQILVVGGNFHQAPYSIQVSRLGWTIQVLNTNPGHRICMVQKNMFPKPETFLFSN